MLAKNDLREIYQALHQIPELALQEFKTKDYLLNIIKNFNQEFLEYKEIKELPTALLVRVKGFAPKRTKSAVGNSLISLYSKNS